MGFWSAVPYTAAEEEKTNRSTPDRCKPSISVAEPDTLLSK